MAEVKKGDKLIASGDGAKQYEVTKTKDDEVHLKQISGSTVTSPTGEPEKQELVTTQNAIAESENWAGFEDADSGGE